MSSQPEDMAVQVCTHICRCYRVSARFDACREAIVEVPNIIKDLCRVLYYKVRLLLILQVGPWLFSLKKTSLMSGVDRAVAVELAN